MRRLFFYHGGKIVFFLLFILFAVITGIYESLFKPDPAAPLVLMWVSILLAVFLRRRVNMLIMQAIWPTARCGKCGEDVDLYGVWKCSCGYVDEGHYYKKCSNCKQFIGGGLLECPSCGMSIKM